ncbi:hypothetical protein [Fuchsiella alkaliacetigena]|uniref:hypothetical protein n=1 Tax=Fuchsiella alkaliacetigena TaxID=957042 RepID=UPI00200A2826|nr:hypothetical protein [Fuchsiella alkaliacetigena]MCK8825366.1 hypothetical protein [Fuchsiella alkaliacetigena]
MAVLTAQMLIGTNHYNQTGLNPSHYLFLSENSRPVWILVSQNIFSSNDDFKTIWIPGLEDTLEVALLMIAIYVLKDEEIRRIVREHLGDLNQESVEVHREISKKVRKQLYKKCRQLNYRSKVVLTIIKESQINRQLEVLTEYQLELDICTPQYSCYYSGWKEKMEAEGKLEVIRDQF